MARFRLICVWRTLRIDPLANPFLMNNLSGLRDSLKPAISKNATIEILHFLLPAPTPSVDLLYHVIH